MMKRNAIAIVMIAVFLAISGAVTAKGQYFHFMGKTGTPRAAHSATMMGTQMVLLAGGMLEDGVSTAETLIYDNIRGVFRDGPPMTMPRASHTATALDDRRILVVGGYDGRTPVTTAEVWEPKENRFVSLGDAPISGGGHTATKLRDGRVLIAGGGDDQASATAILFEPDNNTFSEAAPMKFPRTGHTASLLNDGRVLIVGGSDGENVIATAEIYDPVADLFSPADSLATARYKHAAVKLSDGRVLVMGGATEDDWSARLTSAEIFDPNEGVFTETGSMLTPRFKFADAVTEISDGWVLVAGGGVPEIYDVETGRFSHLDGERMQTLHYATASRFEHGEVIVVGGYTQDIEVEDMAWMYIRLLEAPVETHFNVPESAR
jgi:hypothetical protein